MNILIVGINSIFSKKLISVLELRKNINIFFKTHTINDIFDNNLNYYEISSINIDLVIFMSTLKKGLDNEIYESNVMYPFNLIKKLNQNTIIVNIDTTAYEYRYNAYSYSKKIFKELLSINQYKSINLRIEHIYGYYPSENITSFLIKKMLRDESIDLSSGKQIRNFIYIDDAICGIIKCIENITQFNNKSTIDIASNDRLSIKELVLIIKQITNSKSNLYFDKIIVDDSEFKIIDFDNTILKNLGWQQSICLVEGIKKEIEEIKNEISKI